jgi:DeoR/GlpR family transcriptional regulator of sugar metabolism
MSDSFRNPDARQAELLSQISRAGFMSVRDLAAAAGVSEITVRRDLALLEKDGAVRRTHGGAIGLAAGEADVFDAFEPSFAARRRRNASAKSAIAMAALRYVRPGQSLAIDTGSTTYEFARQCAAKTGLTIVTNSARVASVLADSPNAVYLPAGRLRGGELSIYGSMAVETVVSFSFDLCFIGVSGVTVDGFFDYSPEDAELKRAFIARSGKTVALCDATKFNHRALVKVAGIEQVQAIVCDRSPQDKLAEQLSAAGADIIVAKPR